MKSLQNLKFEFALQPIDANGLTLETATSRIIDTHGYNELAVVLFFGTMAGAYTALSLFESDSPTMAGATLIPNSDAAAATPAILLPAATSDGGIWLWHVDLRNGARQRYIQINGVSAAAANLSAALAILGEPEVAPGERLDRGIDVGTDVTPTIPAAMAPTGRICFERFV